MKNIQPTRKQIADAKTTLLRHEPTKISEDIREHIENKIPSLNYDHIYTLKQIFEDDLLWDAIDRGDRNAAGSYIALLVAAEKLPLKPMGKNSANACLYKRR